MITLLCVGTVAIFGLWAASNDVVNNASEKVADNVNNTADNIIYIIDKAKNDAWEFYRHSEYLLQNLVSLTISSVLTFFYFYPSPGTDLSILGNLIFITTLQVSFFLCGRVFKGMFFTFSIISNGLLTYLVILLVLRFSMWLSGIFA